MSRHSAMSKTECRAAFSLAGILSLRMLGLFMIYPVFALYADDLSGATPFTIGLALGAYGLTQALFQIPFGLLSDRVGRKPVITAGLLLFALGSVIAALSVSIEGVLLGRVVQGAGAVGAVVLALGADLTRETQRTKVMAMIGMSIGLSFALALVLGPVLNGWVGVSGIFWITAVLALLGIGLVRAVVPQPMRGHPRREAEPLPALFRRVLGDAQLLRLDLGIFSLHAVLTASFLALPLVLRDAAGLDAGDQWMIYLPVLVGGAVLMLPFMLVAEKYHRIRPVFLGAIAALGLSQLSLLIWHAGLVATLVALVVFFAAFTLMEASLPSLISKTAPADAKGTAMGVYSSAQFLGVFVGGAAGGWVNGAFGLDGLFVFTTLLVAIWLVAAFGMTNPRRAGSRVLSVGQVDAGEASRLATTLLRVPGVLEAVVVPEDRVAYLKVDGHYLDDEARRAVSAAGCGVAPA